jgi:nucleotide-binding universal stress UspA family protein
MFKHILIPTDGSPLSRAAAEAGVELAKALGARVTGFFAAPAPTPVIYQGAIPVGITTLEKHRKMIKKAAGEYLAAVEKAASKAGVKFEGVTVTSDFPADAILETAKKRKCDLIFMASHARRGINEILLGSQTRKVLAQSPVPVLVYRKRK